MASATEDPANTNPDERTGELGLQDDASDVDEEFSPVGARLSQWGVICSSPNFWGAVLTRWLLPATLITASVLRFNVFSTLYAMAFLVLVIIPSPRLSHKTAIDKFTLAVLILSSTILSSQLLFQLVVGVARSPPGIPLGSPLQQALATVGWVPFENVDSRARALALVPDILVVLVSLACFLLRRQTPLSPPPTTTPQVAVPTGADLLLDNTLTTHTTLGRKFAQLLTRFFALVVLFITGVSWPSLITLFYWVVLMGLLITWALMIPVSGRLMRYVVTGTLYFSCANLIVLHVYQYAQVQSVLPPSTLGAEMAGLLPYNLGALSSFGTMTHYGSLKWSAYVEVAVLVVQVFVFTWLLEAHARDRDFTAGFKVKHLPAGALRQTVRYFADFFVGFEHLLSLAGMSLWACAFHSWLGLIYLVVAAIGWFRPMTVMRFFSPLIVLYALVLTLIDLVYGLQTSKAFPVEPEWGLVYFNSPCLALGLKTLLTVLFFVTYRCTRPDTLHASRPRRRRRHLRQHVTAGDSAGIEGDSMGERQQLLSSTDYSDPAFGAGSALLSDERLMQSGGTAQNPAYIAYEDDDDDDSDDSDVLDDEQILLNAARHSSKTGASRINAILAGRSDSVPSARGGVSEPLLGRDGEDDVYGEHAFSPEGGGVGAPQYGKMSSKHDPAAAAASAAANDNDEAASRKKGCCARLRSLPWSVIVVFLWRVAKFSLEHMFVIVLAAVYILALQQVTLFNAGYMFIMVLLGVVPAIAEPLWPALVFYCEGVVLVQYLWRFTWSEGILSVSTEQVIGLYDPAENLINQIGWSIAVQMLVVIQLHVYRAARSLQREEAEAIAAAAAMGGSGDGPLLRRDTLSENAHSPLGSPSSSATAAAAAAAATAAAAENATASTRGGGATQSGWSLLSVILFIKLLLIDYFFLVCYATLFAVSVAGASTAIHCGFLFFLTVFLVFHATMTRPQRGVALFLLPAVALSVLAVVSMYAYQFEKVQSLFLEVLSDDRLRAIGFETHSGLDLFRYLVGPTLVLLTLVLETRATSMRHRVSAGAFLRARLFPAVEPDALDMPLVALEDNISAHDLTMTSDAGWAGMILAACAMGRRMLAQQIPTWAFVSVFALALVSTNASLFGMLLCVVVAIEAWMLGPSLTGWFGFVAGPLVALITVAQLGYQVPYVLPSAIILNPHYNGSAPDAVSDAPWIGLDKYNDNFGAVIPGIIILIVLWMRRACERCDRREQVRAGRRTYDPMRPMEPFMETERSDDSLSWCLRGIFTNLFAAFGLELCTIAAVVAAFVRLNVIGVVQLLLAVSWVAMSRRKLRAHWTAFVRAYAFLLVVQYAVALAVPPSFTDYVNYPFYGAGTSYWLSNMRVWLWMPPGQLIVVLGADITLLALMLQQRRVFALRLDTSLHAWDFVKRPRSLAASLTMAFYSWWYWICLIFGFSAGAGDVTILNFGYVATSMVCLFSGEYLIMNVVAGRKRWTMLFGYTTVVLFIRMIWQLPATCIDWGLQPQSVITTINTIGLRQGMALHGSDSDTANPNATVAAWSSRGILFDVILFAFLIVQRRLFQSRASDLVAADLRRERRLAHGNARRIARHQRKELKNQLIAEATYLRATRERVRMLRMHREKVLSETGGGTGHERLFEDPAALLELHRAAQAKSEEFVASRLRGTAAHKADESQQVQQQHGQGQEGGGEMMSSADVVLLGTVGVVDANGVPVTATGGLRQRRVPQSVSVSSSKGPSDLGHDDIDVEDEDDPVALLEGVAREEEEDAREEAERETRLGIPSQSRPRGSSRAGHGSGTGRGLLVGFDMVVDDDDYDEEDEEGQHAGRGEHSESSHLLDDAAPSGWEGDGSDHDAGDISAGVPDGGDDAADDVAAVSTDTKNAEEKGALELTTQTAAIPTPSSSTAANLGKRASTTMRKVGMLMLQGVDALLGVMSQVSNDHREALGVERPVIARDGRVAVFLAHLSLIYSAYSHWLVYISVIALAAANATVLAVIPAVVLFCGLSVLRPRPPAWFYESMLFYAEICVCFIYFFQLPCWTFNVNVPYNSGSAIFGIQRTNDSSSLYHLSGYLVVIVTILMHRSNLRQIGLWRGQSTELTRARIAAHEKRQARQRATSSSSSKNSAQAGMVGVGGGEEEEHVGVESESEYAESVGGSSASASASGRATGTRWQRLVRAAGAWTRPGAMYRRDLYMAMVMSDLLSYLVLIFGWSAFQEDQGGNIANIVTTNNVPLTFVIALLVQALLLVLDRCLYLARDLRFKLALQWVLVIFVHVWLFFLTPFVIAHRPFAASSVLVLWYVCKSLYFIASALQIRHGYPRHTGGNALTRSLSTGSQLLFSIYLAIPFLFELRMITDWAVTRTTLYLRDWIQMEDIWIQLYQIKCRNLSRKKNRAKHGNVRPQGSKCCQGLTLTTLLVMLLFLPLLLMAFVRSSAIPVQPQIVTVSLGFIGYQPLWEMTASANVLTTLTDAQAGTLQDTYGGIVGLYQASDMTSARFTVASRSLWAASPPDIADLHGFLANGTGTAFLRMKMEYTRSPPTALVTAEILGTYETLYAPGEATRQAFVDVLDAGEGAVFLPNLFPAFVEVPISGVLHPVLTQSLVNCTAVLRSLSNGTDDVVSWWELDQSSPLVVPDSSGSVPIEPLRPQLVSFSERAASASLSFVASSGVVGLYVSVVLVVGRFLRLAMSNAAQQILFTCLPHVSAVEKLCQDIYDAREENVLDLEEALFAELIYLYRSPQTLILWSNSALGTV